MPNVTTLKHRDSAAFNVERARSQLLENVQVPPELVSRALAVAAAGLEAMETRFFAHKGRVVDRTDVINWQARQRAADQIFSMAGLYQRDAVAKPSTPSVAVEVDPTSGVVRLVVQQTEALPEAETLSMAPLEEVIDSEHRTTEPSVLEAGASPSPPIACAQADEAPVIIRMKDIPESVRRELFGDG